MDHPERRATTKKQVTPKFPVPVTDRRFSTAGENFGVFISRAWGGNEKNIPIVIDVSYPLNLAATDFDRGATINDQESVCVGQGGNMAIRKRGDSWQIDYLDPGGKRVRQSFKTRKEATAEHGKRVSLIAEGRYLDVKPDYKTTLAELCSKYTENFGPQSSFKRAKTAYLENFKNNLGADRRLADILFVDVETYRNTLRQKPVSATVKGRTFVYGQRKDSSVNREMACMHHLFKKAVEWGLMERSPFDGKTSLKLKENNKRMRFLSETEIMNLLDGCSPHLKPMVECAVLTGMRRGEILSLKWQQVRNGFIYLEKTKTNEARQVPISDALEAAFRDIRRREHLRSEYVFTYQGGPIQDNFYRTFRTALKRAGLQDFHFHDLRHTFASQVLLRGGTLKDVQELLGHKSMTLTLRYAHLTQEHKRKAVNLLNGLTGDCHKNVTSTTQAVSNLLI